MGVFECRYGRPFKATDPKGISISCAISPKLPLLNFGILAMALVFGGHNQGLNAKVIPIQASWWSVSMSWLVIIMRERIWKIMDLWRSWLRKWSKIGPPGLCHRETKVADRLNVSDGICMTDSGTLKKKQLPATCNRRKYDSGLTLTVRLKKRNMEKEMH